MVISSPVTGHCTTPRSMQVELDDPNLYVSQGEEQTQRGGRSKQNMRRAFAARAPLTLPSAVRYFSSSEASYTCPVIFETTAFSGAWPLIAQNIVRQWETSRRSPSFSVLICRCCAARLQSTCY